MVVVAPSSSHVHTAVFSLDKGGSGAGAAPPLLPFDDLHISKYVIIDRSRTAAQLCNISSSRHAFK